MSYRNINHSPSKTVAKLFRVQGISLISLITLCSCTTIENGQSNNQSVTVPEKWQNADIPGRSIDTEILKSWWTQFHDPILERLISDALVSSPDIRTALSKIAESRARRGVEESVLWPSLSADVNGREDYTRNHNTNTTTKGDSYSAGLDASWEIDLFGKNRLAVDAATFDLEQTKENYYAAQVSLAAEVAQTYVSLRASEAQLSVLHRNLVTRSETTELTQWNEQSGVGNALDTQQAISSLEQARAGIPSLQQSIAQTRNRLALLSGLTPGSLDKILEEQRPIPVPPQTVATGIPAETLHQRPDIRAAENAVEAATARMKAAERERLPSLKITGSIGVTADNFGDLFSPDATVGNIVAGLTAPIFEGGRISQNIMIQNEIQKQALISYENTVLTALSEVEDALIAIQHTSRRLDTLRKASEAAQQATELASLQYEAGEVDIVSVLEAQRTQLSIEEQEVSTYADQSTAYIQLYKALGGGWIPQEI